MTLPSYGVDFLRDVFNPRYSEISLLIARKNSKSGVAAVRLLAHLIGPVRSLGFRAGIVSVSKEKANELKNANGGDSGIIEVTRRGVSALTRTRARGIAFRIGRYSLDRIRRHGFRLRHSVRG